MSNQTPSAIDPRTQTEVHPDVLAAYADPGPGIAFWAGAVGSSSPAPPLTPPGGLAIESIKARKRAGGLA